MKPTDFELAGMLRNKAAELDELGHVPSATFYRGHAKVLERRSLCDHRFVPVSCTPFSVHEECRCGAWRPVEVPL